MLPVISQYLLVNQNVVADPVQPSFAALGNLSGVQVPPGTAGIAVANVEKLGLDTTTHHVRWLEGVMTGEVTVEVSSEVNYAGAWTPVGVVTFSGVAPKEDTLVIKGPYGAFRHRITQPVQGGSVTTKIVGTT